MATEGSMPRPIGENALFYSDSFIFYAHVSSVNIDLWVIADLLWAGYRQL